MQKKVSDWCAAVRFTLWQANRFFFLSRWCRRLTIQGCECVCVCVSSPQNVFLETPFVVWTTTERFEHFAKGLFCQQDNETQSGVFTGVWLRSEFKDWWGLSQMFTTYWMLRTRGSKLEHVDWCCSIARWSPGNVAAKGEVRRCRPQSDEVEFGMDGWVKQTQDFHADDCR